WPVTCSLFRLYSLQIGGICLQADRKRIRLAYLIAALCFMLVLALRGPSEVSRRFSAAQKSLAQTKPASPQANDPTVGVGVPAQALPPSKFCAFGPKAYVVYVPLDITVANGRRTPIVLTRYLHVQRVLVGKNTGDVQAHKYELATAVRPFRSFGEGVTFGTQPDDDSWVILKHNQTYE